MPTCKRIYPNCIWTIPQLFLCSRHEGILELCNRHHPSLHHFDITYDSQTQRQAQLYYPDSPWLQNHGQSLRAPLRSFVAVS